MSQAPPQTPRKTARGSRIRLSNVDWKDYTRFLRLFEEHPGFRLTYDHGELEIMSPLFEHDKDGYILGRLVDVLTEELGLRVVGGGSVTIRRRRRQRGLEPDNCYWIANAARVASLRRINLNVDPPPDLAIEVDVTRSSLPRLSVYASLGVPEVWHVAGDVLTFYLLQPTNVYSEGTHSLAFPFLTPADLLPFLQQARQGTGGDDNAIIRSFRAWLQPHKPPVSP
jgi:Uma2 family endonuclease